MNKIVRACVLLWLLCVPGESLTQNVEAPAGAAIDPAPFRYSRQIPESPAGLTALPLDAAALAHSRPDLADLRIVDANDRQVPYLLDRTEDGLVIDLPTLIPEKAPPAGQSQYQVMLPFENLPPATLSLITTERLFQRNVAVQVKRPDSRMETIALATWHHDDPETPAPPLTLSVRSGLGTTSATVIVDEGDNQPLALAGARLGLPLYRLRFFYPAEGKLRLLYGQESLAAPRYDLELLAPRLAGVSSRDLELGAEAPLAAATEPFIGPPLFWTALVVAVGVVLFLLVRLLRSEQAG